jgi:glutamate/aspartate transport system substrate-binding protein
VRVDNEHADSPAAGVIRADHLCFGRQGGGTQESPIREIADLDGKVVVTTSGTTTERVVRSVLNMRKFSSRIVQGGAFAYRFAVDGGFQPGGCFVIDEALFAGLMANSPHADKLGFIEENFGYEPYSMVMRRDDPEFKKIVDQALRGMMQSGELERCTTNGSCRRFRRRGSICNLPMSDLLKDLIQNPNDEGN